MSKMKDYFLDPVFVRALQPFAPAATDQHEHIWKTDCGLTLTCHLEFSPGERGLQPDTATLISAWVGPYDIAPVLALEIVDAIEADFLRGRAWR